MADVSIESRISLGLGSVEVSAVELGCARLCVVIGPKAHTATMQSARIVAWVKLIGSGNIAGVENKHVEQTGIPIRDAQVLAS